MNLSEITNLVENTVILTNDIAPFSVSYAIQGSEVTIFNNLGTSGDDLASIGSFLVSMAKRGSYEVFSNRVVCKF